jgi:hypothetical protein
MTSRFGCFARRSAGVLSGCRFVLPAGMDPSPNRQLDLFGGATYAAVLGEWGVRLTGTGRGETSIGSRATTVFAVAILRYLYALDGALRLRTLLVVIGLHSNTKVISGLLCVFPHREVSRKPGHKGIGGCWLRKSVHLRRKPILGPFSLRRITTHHR